MTTKRVSLRIKFAAIGAHEGIKNVKFPIFAR